ncbi:MAG: hypothetical protein EZS28_013701 [Streblomastix strix]|uniref:Uncharacterized protein n=1 Tax=Streblomastix strix TaxID=222440 RepID=A0A5J4W861_9EUKA|nr:MAG: hypothetical protein EZS28_013701 [Streblomastix strix]
MIHTPNLLHSLILLCTYNINFHINEEEDEESSLIRSSSGLCLGQIQEYGDESTQSELVRSEYAVVSVLQVSIAGGDGEQEDYSLDDGLNNITEFIKSLHQGRQTNEFNQGPSFPQQICLARITDEQIEEEGGNEEIEAQLIYQSYYYYVKEYAKGAKSAILNYFVDQENSRLYLYDQ